MTDSIDYGNLMHDAMRGLICRVLRMVEKDGLIGDHHFFIKFSTLHPDVELSDWLSDRYPDEMTIVIQNWFDNLVVGEDGFSITLNFSDNPEPLYIPYDAILTFVDPSVEFGLKFETHEIPDPQDQDLDEAPETEQQETEDSATEKEPGEVVVSLDSFRKR